MDVSVRFVITVRPSYTATFAYAGALGIVAWPDGALRFDSVEEAHAEITRRGWTESYDAVQGVTTAYVAYASK